MRKYILFWWFQILCVGLLNSTFVLSQVKPDSKMFMLRAFVVDKNEKAVENLKSENFVVKEDGVEQKIEYFSADEEPADVLILMDVSASSEQHVRGVNAVQALEFIRQSGTQNKYALAAFNNKVTELADWGSDEKQLTEALNKTVAPKKTEGNTAFFDAVIYGLKKLSNSRHEKKILLVFSDGQENVSKASFYDLKKEIKNSDALFIIVAPAQSSAVQDAAFLEEVCEMSGGKAYFVQTNKEMEEIVKKIVAALQSQYVIGYIPKASLKSKGWRKVQVKTSTASEKGGSLKLTVRTREGYFSDK